jgi:hypothetical protein
MTNEDNLDLIKDFAKEGVESNIDKLEGLLKKYELENLHSDFADKIVFLFIAALGIITAVSWDQVLKIVAEKLFGEVGDIWSKVLYAVLVTVITVLVSIIVNKIYVKRRSGLNKRSFVDIVRMIIRDEKK